MKKETKKKALKNRDILKKYFKPISSNPLHIYDWKTFLELSKTAKMIWCPNASRDFDKIDLISDALDKLYIFTDAIPAEGIYDFIYTADSHNNLTVDVQNNPIVTRLNIIILSICELKFTKEIEHCFWKRVTDAIANGENIDRFRDECQNQEPQIVHLNFYEHNFFSRIVNNLKKDNSAKLIGRIFLMSLMLGKSDILNLTRQYVLYMFVDNNYFEQTYLGRIGLKCTKLE